MPHILQSRTDLFFFRDLARRRAALRLQERMMDQGLQGPIPVTPLLGCGAEAHGHLVLSTPCKNGIKL